ncbi:helix-turn-helix domain-containing protein [Pseudoalteromonas luteoviolacea]|uniref:helix-turn-helix domain-containing protein n=1 Tax=Pseudoalteromonas luteoviolacea TaxID=43657 RepID=UPI001B397E9F|nr:helix-turn-helix domain-containing protein [Pseudoalteromonas luteoviolacea]MBQ4834742.1 AraC family transcriptional regulator [Pseudoalteromonas luteoviolacea]
MSQPLFFYLEQSNTFLQLGLTSYFLAAPLLFAYIKQTFKLKTSKNINWKIHLLPPTSLALIIGITWPYDYYTLLWSAHISTVIGYIWFGYLFASLLAITPVVINKSLDITADQNGRVAIVVLCCTTALWLAYIFSTYTSIYVAIVCFLLSTYLSLEVLMARRLNTTKEKYASKKIPHDLAAPILSRLEKMMEEDELYKCPNLSLSQVANRLKVSVPHLSQVLNDNLGVSFTSYINQYRITLAKQLLRKDTSMSLKQISELCGYNNQSTFYIAFKKFSDTTPAKYRKKAKQSSPIE